ncbi:Protein SSUH2-like protein [Aphelenchoides besseyi]|nr:Protein SSUH2-like protein [Aphelenchoides besseyi]KAI6202297.1 Protein SSUH2-like protein [Aphelenchoides besseyi]
MSTSPTAPQGGGFPLHFNLIPPPRKDDDSNQETRNFLTHTSVSDFTTSSKRYYEGCNQIHESDIRKSLLVESKRRKYWGTKTIEKMEFEDIEHSCCYHYVLESFTETRSTAETTEPCAIGQMIDSQGAENVKFPAPNAHRGSNLANIQNPWDYEVLPSAEFVGQTRVLELPSTSQLIPCQICNSEGVSHCFHCRGFGTDKCGYCRGTGMKAGVAHPAVYTHPMVATFPHADTSRGYPGSGSAIVRPPSSSGNRPYAVGTPVHFMAKAGLPPPGIGQHDLCIFCQGRGIRDCHHCKGQGKKQCGTCAGHGTVRQYIKLKVFFAVERSDFFTQSEVPEVFLRAASGEVSLCESSTYVSPLKKFSVKEINEASKKYCAQHLQKSLGACRVIKQRQTVEAIPVAKVKFKIGTKKCGIFYVFGNERLCFIPKSPSKCSIM